MRNFHESYFFVNIYFLARKKSLVLTGKVEWVGGRGGGTVTDVYNPGSSGETGRKLSEFLLDHNVLLMICFHTGAYLKQKMASEKGSKELHMALYQVISWSCGAP